MTPRASGSLIAVVWLFCVSDLCAAVWQVGVAAVDITPGYPVRLTGYAARKHESEGVAQRVWAKALAIGSDRENPAILITADNCGIPLNVRNEVVTRLQQIRGIRADHVAICATHTHCAPWLKGFAPNIFGGPIPGAEMQHVEAYTRDFTDALVTLALNALEDRRPALLSHGTGAAGFAANRMPKGGPVDTNLPALFVSEPDGKLRAVFASYACHCTTLGGDFNQVCGDWAGFAEETVERDHPGAVALIALGCAADANPSPRSKLEQARQYGQEIAGEINRLFAGPLAPLNGKLVCRLKQIELPFDTLPTRAQWEAVAALTNYAGAHARMNLERLARGETLPTNIVFIAQSWTFGGKLAMVFLSGEVVVDYSLRLKQEFDSARFWVNAYANDVPCYIPSERVLKEGGYEAGDAMVFYDKPCRLAPGLEDKIIQTVHELVPEKFARSHRPSRPVILPAMMSK